MKEVSIGKEDSPWGKKGGVGGNCFVFCRSCGTKLLVEDVEVGNLNLSLSSLTDSNTIFHSCFGHAAILCTCTPLDFLWEEYEEEGGLNCFPRDRSVYCLGK